MSLAFTALPLLLEYLGRLEEAIVLIGEEI